MDKELLKQIEMDFANFKKDIIGIILFGSYAIGEATKRSDIDICLVLGSKKLLKEIFNKILTTRLTEKYDIKIFESLPLSLKGEILDNGVVVWARDQYELSYYLYKWKRIWQDQKISLNKLGIKIFDKNSVFKD